MTNPIAFETRGACAVITIDRPEARNAVSPEVARGLEAAIDRLEEDAALQVGVLTGTPPVFCAGADLKAIGEGRARELSTDRGGFAGLVRRERSKPLIAAVDGPALAGGMELTLACDLVVASTQARFGVPEVKRGLMAAAGGLIHLPSKLPFNLAMECILTGDPISAERAHEHGYVSALCDPGAALATALELAERIAGNAPLAVRTSRRLLLTFQETSDDEAWAINNEENVRLQATADVQEGVRAFIEKRPPAWSGR
jgi:enoyl-CoA hydratase